MVSPYTAYSVSIVNSESPWKDKSHCGMGFGNWFVFFIKIMKKGSIIKGKRVIGVLESMNNSIYRIKLVKYDNIPYLYPISWVELKNLKNPTRKEKEEYKKFLLKHGYSYYRGKVTKEL